MVTITCPNDSTVCDTMEGAGAGLGIFLEYLGTALPTFLIILALVGGIVAIVVAVGYAIKGSVKAGVRTR